MEVNVAAFSPGHVEGPYVETVLVGGQGDRVGGLSACSQMAEFEEFAPGILVSGSYHLYVAVER